MQSNRQLKYGGGLAAAIAAIIAAVFAIEGGYVNNPRDPGGETNHGVTVAVARQHGYTGPMRELPQSVASDIYRASYIEQPGLIPIVEASPALGHKLADAGVNAGPARAATWLQRSLNAYSRACRDYPCIAEDGRIGSKTLNAYRALERKRGRVKACELVIKSVEAQQAGHYLALERSNPARYGEFVVGWMDHRVQNVPIERCQEAV